LSKKHEKHKKRVEKRAKKPKSKRGRRSTQPRLHTPECVPELENWCSNLCAAGSALRDYLLPLGEVLNKALKRGRITAAEVRAVALKPLSGRLEAVDCRFLDGLTIDILKKTAFVEGSDKNEFSWECYGLINSIWNKRYREQIERAECYDQCRPDHGNAPCDKQQHLASVFDTERLLENWTSQLCHVKAKSLWSYVHVLVCKGLAEHPRFGEAVTGLKSHITECVFPAHPAEAARAGEAFIGGVLAPMLEKHTSAVVKYLLDAAEIVACTVFSDKAGLASVDALKQLTSLATQLRSALIRSADGADGSECDEALSATYQLLREKCTGLSKTLKRRVGGHLGSLMPSLCSRKTRSPRKRALKGTELRLDIAENDQIWQLSGRVIDFCSHNGVAHVHFDTLESCVTIRDNRQLIPGTSLESSPLLVTYRDHGRKLVRELHGHLRIPLEGRSGQEDIISCSAWPLRGWRSSTPEQGCRAVFLLKGAEDKIVALAEHLPTVLYHESTAMESAYASGEERSDAEALCSSGVVQAAAGDIDEFWMLKKGDMWNVCYEGKQTFVKPSIGIDYIARLLHEPFKELDVAALRALVSCESTPPRLGSAGERIDQQAMKAYKTHLHGIRDELHKAESNNDIGRIEVLQSEKTALETEIREASGLGGRIREDSDDAKRAMDSVGRAIARALDSIKRCHEKLGCHLHDSLRMGRFVSYAPATEISWTVKWT
jgi:hypothetical protein